jgi:thermitase
VRARTLPFALIALALLVPEVAAAATPAEIVIKRGPGLDAEEREELREDAGVRLVETLDPERMELVRARNGERALETLLEHPDVEIAAPNVRVRASSDPLFPQQWGFNQDPSDVDIDLPEAWVAAPARGAGVTVAVVDGGVNTSHPEFSGRIASGPNFVDDDDCDDPDLQPFSHGTHVAGTIGAAVDGAGTVGAAPAAGLSSVRALDSCGGGELSWILNALDWAGSSGARVVNASLGSEPLDDFTVQEIAGINAIYNAVFTDHSNVLYVVAAGNETNNNDQFPVFPCNATAANLVCVGASTKTDGMASFSNWGATSVDLFAPGSLIHSTLQSGYGPMNGTSMASPHVAGVAALVRGQRPDLSATQVKAALLAGAEDKPAFAGKAVRPGRLNAVASTTGLPAPLPDSDGDGVSNASDNCPTTSNGSQADADGDRVGDVCDPAPRGPDADGDGKPALDDGCPTQFANTVNGCPVVITPVEVVPSFMAVSAKARKRVVTVTVRADRAATVGVTIQRKRCTRGKCRWVRVASRAVIANSGKATVRVKRLKRGSHRAIVRLSNRVGTSKPRFVRFRVR